MSSLSWEDLFVDAANLDVGGLLSEWPGLINGQVRPIGASVFGDLFFERRSGEVEKLDVLEGGVHFVAGSFREFETLMNDGEWQELNLLSAGIALIKEKGLSRGPSQFFGFAPHPAIAGKIDWATVVVLDAAVWNSICAQTLTRATATPATGSSEQPRRPWWKLGRG
ncbi:MAG TPA: hypothetical protein VGN52_11135 [Burkholderiales bacterium]